MPPGFCTDSRRDVGDIYKLYFLYSVGWGTDQLSGFGEERGTKHQVINLVHSVRTVMRIPLILLNSLTILLLLLMG